MNAGVCLDVKVRVCVKLMRVLVCVYYFLFFKWQRTPVGRAAADTARYRALG